MGPGRLRSAKISPILGIPVKITKEQITKWVSRHFEYKLRSGGNQITICNPFDGDTGWHFWISTQVTENKHGKKGIWVHDFRPDKYQYGTSFVKFVQKFKNLSYFDALKDICGGSVKLADKLRAQRAEEIDEPEEIVKRIELPKCKHFSDKDDSVARNLALSYLSGRCISEETAIRYSLGYTPTHIVFPYFEFGELVYWQKREIGSKMFEFPPEGSTGLKKTNFLFGFDQIEPDADVAVTEAIIDSISIGDFAVATGGAGLSGLQARKIKAMRPSRVILCPDNDRAGKKSLRQDYELLKSLMPMESLFICLPPDPFKDWNEMDQERSPGTSGTYIKRNAAKLTLARLIATSVTPK